jgi:hypothetical protein
MLNLTKICEITKIFLVIFLIFEFNLTAIFNGIRVFETKRKFDTLK